MSTPILSYFANHLRFKDSDYLNIVDRCLANNAEQQIKKTILQIENNYSKAPYFKELLPVIKSGFYYNETNLFKYLFNSIQQVCKYLHIKTKLIVASKVDIDHSLQCQNKVIALNRKLGADIYINAIGGLQLYDSSVFLKNGIELKFIKTNTIEYPQFSKEFKSYMSIIDVMMFNSAETINQFLKEYTLI